MVILTIVLVALAYLVGCIRGAAMEREHQRLARNGVAGVSINGGDDSSFHDRQAGVLARGEESTTAKEAEAARKRSERSRKAAATVRRNKAAAAKKPSTKKKGNK